MIARRDDAAIAYPFKNGIYLNITNRCPTACRFCIKRLLKWRFEQWNFRLAGAEPSVSQILAAICAVARRKRFSEIVFCGYGESTYRLPEILEISREIRALRPRARLRLNTVGLGNLIWDRNIVPELRSALDAVAVSINTADPDQWVRIHAPLAHFRRKGFESAIEFVRHCVASGLDTTVTAVRLPGADVAAVRRLAASLGAKFRPRPAL
ncbi:MAG TPA: radical SAM protein [Elusimicrobia bacterium]|nr:radical SAM protein [Elusimicrobiota bacterium]HBT61869.1 radical SAM protein [Elusimicrobiota bacterium]